MSQSPSLLKTLTNAATTSEYRECVQGKELVKGKFLKLNSQHIEYALDCMKTNTTKVHNIKKYLLAILFNAPSTISGYYQAEVNHDMPQYAVKQ